MEISERQIIKLVQSYFCWLRLPLNRGISLLAIGAIVTCPTIILLWENPVLAQTVAQSPQLNKNTIYVNAKDGDDTQAGKKDAPLKTITQALSIATPNSTIQLAKGTYSKESGETFPVILKDGIVLQGDLQNQGYETIIQGDGYFISPTGAGQNVAIVAQRGAGAVLGVTVTNSRSRGHGIWIESASPQILGNTFTQNGNTGVSVNGNSAPTIEDNYFYNNSGNGLLVYGTSQPEVVKNTFEQTGFGVSAVQNTALKLTENLFDGNRIGVILEGNSQATLRGNEIVNSTESGLTAIAQSRVDLGTDEEPGNNVFRSNKKLDIHNATTNPIVAVGSTVKGETVGEINFSGGSAVATASGSVDRTFRDLPPLPDRDPLQKPQPAPVPIPLSTEPAANLPAPPPVLADNAGNKELIFTPPASESAFPEAELPVPAIPPIDPQNSLARYKVLVEVLDTGEESEVRSLYPEAFKTIFQGQPWLQVGAFSNWDKAKRAEQNLINLGLATYLLE